MTMLTKTRVIDYDEAVRLVESVMNKEGFGPDYVYQNPDPEQPTRCFNVWNGEGSCIIGRALIEMGVEPEWFKQTGMRPAQPFSDVSRDLEIEKSIRFTSKAYHFLREIQSCQDTKVPWGQAIRSAKRDVEDLSDDMQH